jgi:hypothetical protein
MILKNRRYEKQEPSRDANFYPFVKKTVEDALSTIENDRKNTVVPNKKVLKS